MHQHSETDQNILRSINQVRRSLFLLDGVRTQPTDDILDQVHRFAHEAERLTERWTAALGGTVKRRPTTVDLARGHGLLVELRVTQLRLALSDAVMVFVVGLRPERLCDHLAPLLQETRELFEALRGFDSLLNVLVDGSYRWEARLYELANLVEAVTPNYARPLNAFDLEALEDARALDIAPSFLAALRGDRKYLTSRQVLHAVTSLAGEAAKR